MNWVVYMLKCNDSSIYTGISNNLNRRLDTHAKGNGSKYVRARLPFKLIYTEKCLSRSKAIKREIEIKKLDKKNKEFSSKREEILSMIWNMEEEIMGKDN